jgi:hypothetical protein
MATAVVVAGIAVGSYALEHGLSPHIGKCKDEVFSDAWEFSL